MLELKSKIKLFVLVINGTCALMDTLFHIDKQVWNSNVW